MHTPSPTPRVLRLAAALSMGVIVALHASCSSTDPRCTSLCQVHDRTYGDVCSQASASACVDQCNAQIGSAPTACAACLLQGASFESSGSSTLGESCMSPSTQCSGGSLCTLPSSGCTYCDGDMAAYNACLQKEYPRREVTCTPKFRDPAKCSAVCPANA